MLSLQSFSDGTEKLYHGLFSAAMLVVAVGVSLAGMLLMLLAASPKRLPRSLPIAAPSRPPIALSSALSPAQASVQAAVNARATQSFLVSLVIVCLPVAWPRG
jgi:hypothetical protein